MECSYATVRVALVFESALVVSAAINAGYSLRVASGVPGVPTAFESSMYPRAQRA